MLRSILFFGLFSIIGSSVVGCASSSPEETQGGTDSALEKSNKSSKSGKSDTGKKALTTQEQCEAKADAAIKNGELDGYGRDDYVGNCIHFSGADEILAECQKETDAAIAAGKAPADDREGAVAECYVTRQEGLSEGDGDGR